MKAIGLLGGSRMGRSLILILLAILSACTSRPTTTGDTVYLNHFYVVLDAETYAAVDSSSFLHDEFAAFERRTTVRTDKTYTGIYFYGTNTYFEFFDGSKQSEFRQGVSGLALSPEESGALEALHRQIESEPPQLITRKFGVAQVPWFTMLEPKGLSPDASVNPWFMEYHPRFLAEWH